MYDIIFFDCDQNVRTGNDNCDDTLTLISEHELWFIDWSDFRSTNGRNEVASAPAVRLALVSICEIDVTSFSEDGRGVKWLCNQPKPFPYSNH
jgi:hypothetical protein